MHMHVCDFLPVGYTNKYPSHAFFTLTGYQSPWGRGQVGLRQAFWIQSRSTWKCFKGKFFKYHQFFLNVTRPLYWTVPLEFVAARDATERRQHRNSLMRTSSAITSLALLSWVTQPMKAFFPGPCKVLAGTEVLLVFLREIVCYWPFPNVFL